MYSDIRSKLPNSLVHGQQTSSFGKELLVSSDILRIIPFLFLVLCGPVLGGPQTNFHGNMTDQELFWGTDQYDFSVEVPAAGLECFWHFAHRGERFYLSFMVQWVTGVGHDRHLSVTVNAPSSTWTEESGFYQMCFSNFHNRFGTMQVFLSFGVYYDGYKDPDKTKEEEKKKKEEASKDLNNTLSVIEVQWVTGVGHDRHLSVTVNAPSSLIMATVDDAKGQINFETEETGFYQMCFSNFHNRFGTMQVFLSFGVYYDGYKDPDKTKEEEKKKKEEASKDLNNTLSVIEGATHKVENHVFHMFRYYNFGRMRKSTDFFLLLSNSQYVTWWSLFLSLLIVTSGYLQLLFLKRLFISKSGTKEEKPRC
ncbi:transmembrane emp24 domain-containing protein 6-like [Pseudochaenichthys georgianus]|uniref:transmembrane emp24 domain-containing protein 6-like n=1 Tax=Pseudochaenichthys georgianus TaxID=52239 RepID=UPI0039C162CE